VGESLFAWSHTHHRLTAIDVEPHPADVIDSWLVEDGWARGLALHRARFTESCRARHDAPLAVTEEFFDAALSALPRRGRWFPRVELQAGAGLRLRLRAAPARSAQVRLAVAVAPDRRDPTIKGPDLELLEALRATAVRRGADELLLTSGSGAVLEGTVSSAMWWRDGILCMPPPDLPILPGVTRRLIVEIASDCETEVRFETCAPEALDGLEVWAANALHGIRFVSSWLGADRTPGYPGRAALWQSRLVEKAVPIDQFR